MIKTPLALVSVHSITIISVTVMAGASAHHAQITACSATITLLVYLATEPLIGHYSKLIPVWLNVLQATINKKNNTYVLLVRRIASNATARALAPNASAPIFLMDIVFMSAPTKPMEIALESASIVLLLASNAMITPTAKTAYPITISTNSSAWSTAQPTFGPINNRNCVLRVAQRINI